MARESRKHPSAKSQVYGAKRANSIREPLKSKLFSASDDRRAAGLAAAIEFPQQRRCILGLIHVAMTHRNRWHRNCI